MANSTARYRMPAELWARMKILIPSRPRTTARGGRPPVENLKPIADAIFYKMRTGCQWNAIPRSFAPSSTVHDYFQRWVELGIFEKMWELALMEYDDLVGVAWDHQSLDSATVKSPLGGKKNRPQSDGSWQAWMQTLRPGRRAWRAAFLRDSRSKRPRLKAGASNTSKAKVQAQAHVHSEAGSPSC
jgi:transposase